MSQVRGVEYVVYRGIKEVAGSALLALLRASGLGALSAPKMDGTGGRYGRGGGRSSLARNRGFGVGNRESGIGVRPPSDPRTRSPDPSQSPCTPSAMARP